MEINKKALLQLYLIDRKSTDKISKELGIPSTTLNRRLKEFGIKKRTISESRQGMKLSPEHRAKVIKTLHQGKGKDNPNWKGGVTLREAEIKKGEPKQWYRIVRKPEHPFAEKNGYILEHRLIMEKSLGRFLKKNEFVHHINGNKQDNRIENLQLMQTQRHYGKLECPYCHKEFLVN